MTGKDTQGKGWRASLKDTGGATLIMALLALLVAAMVSAVILAAATTTVKQEKQDREFTQCQLDLQSAAQFVKEVAVYDLNNSKDTGITVKVTRKVDPDTGDVTDEVDSVEATTGEVRSVKQAFEDAVKSYMGMPAVGNPKPVLITLTGPDSDGRSVRAVFELVKNNNEPTSANDSGCSMKITFDFKDAEELGSKSTLCIELSQVIHERSNEGSVISYRYGANVTASPSMEGE